MTAPEATEAVARDISERELQDAVIKCAERLGYLVYHPYDSRRSNPGYPDLTIVGQGRLLFVELKSARGRLRSEQRMWLYALTISERAEVYVFRPCDWLSGRVEATLRGEAA